MEKQENRNSILEDQNENKSDPQENSENKSIAKEEGTQQTHNIEEEANQIKAEATESDPLISSEKDNDTTSEPVPVNEDVSSVSETKQDNQQSIEEPTTKATDEDNNATEASSATESQTNADKQEVIVNDKDGEENQEEDENEDIDYSSFDKEALVKKVEELNKYDDPRKADQQLKEIKPFYDEIKDAERQAAYENFIAEGGEEDGFEYRGDKLDDRFQASFKLIKDRKSQHIAQLERNKDQNLEAKNQILEKLRQLVDSEETNASISSLKKIQDEWRSVGPIPNGQVKSLWANYSALIDRFYDNRSIYFELKELDRKKNLGAKLELCEKAEGLDKLENLKDATKQLNELHEEFKHIGPVPKEDQEPLWQRFKAASDAVYAKRREFVETLKEELGKNLKVKAQLAEEVQVFTEFDSDRITEWNAKTKKILELQNKWTEVGGLPRDKAKAVNKRFWAAFKIFFNNKSQFFKKLEGQRDENLKRKQELLSKALEVKDSEDAEKAANVLKDLQKEWKEIGPVPEKHRNEVYAQFKKACDEFFDRKRGKNKEVEKEYTKNLKSKEAICEQLENMAKNNEEDVEKVEDLIDEYNEIGFVPRNSIKSIQKRFTQALDNFAKNVENLSAEERKELVYSAQYQKLKSSPNASRKINRKEHSIRKQIENLENDISLWKNNIEFFAESKTADKLREEFDQKISKAREELKNLKQELKVLRSI
jgi:hypothetical protein